ncbi:MAG TPA: TetR/AcrR family transcriptional regulator [Pseudonocardia sp.]|nr:TetR/AcrR family transcriptional regulator [Pseudonocardia sp.]
METGVPRRPARAERARQILDAAVAVFTERGYHGASMDAVAERVGVTKPVLYTHFGSKDGLLMACIARARAELLELTAAAAARADGPEDALRRSIRAFFDHLDATGPVWMLVYAQVGGAGEALEAVRAQQTDLVTRLLAAHAPGLAPRRLEAWAQMIVGACERLAVWRAGTAGEPISSGEATDLVMDLLGSGLAGGR